MKTVPYYVTTKQYLYKGEQTDLSFIGLFQSWTEAYKCLVLYKKYIKSRPDPYFGNVDEAWYKEIGHGGFSIWIKGGKAISVRVTKILVTT